MCQRQLQRPTGQYNLLAITRGDLSELDDKITQLKTPHALVTGLREIIPVLIRKLPPFQLHFILSEIATQATRGEKSTVVLTNCEPCELQ